MTNLPIGIIVHLSANPEPALRAAAEMDLTVLQLGYNEAADTPASKEAILATIQELGLHITTVFCGFPGEGYADIATVRATVGLVPLSTQEARVERFWRIARFAQDLGVKRVAAHLGFIPPVTDAQYRPFVELVGTLCAGLAEHGQVLALETGQETAAALAQFIRDVEQGGASNLTVNFDPANMILYGNDNPVEALDLLTPWIDEIHCKDGLWPTQPGILGHEVPFGAGAVDVPRFLKRLVALGFTGPLIIEREISGEQQRRDVEAARDLIRAVLASAPAE